jgi:hypothetical protein
MSKAVIPSELVGPFAEMFPDSPIALLAEMRDGGVGDVEFSVPPEVDPLVVREVVSWFVTGKRPAAKPETVYELYEARATWRTAAGFVGATDLRTDGPCPYRGADINFRTALEKSNETFGRLLAMTSCAMTSCRGSAN